MSVNGNLKFIWKSWTEVICQYHTICMQKKLIEKLLLSILWANLIECIGVNLNKIIINCKILKGIEK